MTYLTKMTVLFVAEFKKLIHLLKSYPLDFIGSTVSLIIAIVGIIWGFYHFLNINNTVNLIIYPLLLVLVGGPSIALREDVEIGTFEQVFNSNYTIAEIIICRTLVSFVISIFQVIIILILTRIYINANIVLSPLFVLFALINGISIGVILAGLTIIYKKVGSFINIIHLLVLIELAIPINYKSPLYKIILGVIVPFNSIVLLGQNANITFTTYLIAILNTFFWILLAYNLYKSMYNYARKTGRLGSY